MSTRWIIAIASVAWVLVVLPSSFYQVDETQTVIITQFGRPVGVPLAEPGLRMKIPFLQVANRFDKRILGWDGDADQVPTRDKEFITVDTYALWRISDPLRFYQHVHDEPGVRTWLDDIVIGMTRGAVASHDLADVVGGGNRGELTFEILERAAERGPELGIEILDVRFKRVNYIEEVRDDAIARMIAANKRRALEIYQETLDFLKADPIGDSQRSDQIAEIELKVSELERELGI